MDRFFTTPLGVHVLVTSLLSLPTVLTVLRMYEYHHLTYGKIKNMNSSNIDTFTFGVLVRNIREDAFHWQCEAHWWWWTLTISLALNAVFTPVWWMIHGLAIMWPSICIIVFADLAWSAWTLHRLNKFCAAHPYPAHPHPSSNQVNYPQTTLSLAIAQAARDGHEFFEKYYDAERKRGASVKGPVHSRLF